MVKEIVCPGGELIRILNRLHPVRHEQLLIYAAEDVHGRIKNDYPGQPEQLLRGLYRIALVEQARYVRLLERLEYYAQQGNGNGDLLKDAKTGLAKHVENCRGDLEKCHDRYMWWLEKRARRIAEKREIEESEIPGIIRSLDERCLNLSIQ